MNRLQIMFLSAVIGFVVGGSFVNIFTPPRCDHSADLVPGYSREVIVDTVLSEQGYVCIRVDTIEEPYQVLFFKKEEVSRFHFWQSGEWDEMIKRSEYINGIR